MLPRFTTGAMSTEVYEMRPLGRVPRTNGLITHPGRFSRVCCGYPELGPSETAQAFSLSLPLLWVRIRCRLSDLDTAPLPCFERIPPKGETQTISSAPGIRLRQTADSTNWL
jgi:hypothetical protein